MAKTFRWNVHGVGQIVNVLAYKDAANCVDPWKNLATKGSFAHYQNARLLVWKAFPKTQLTGKYLQAILHLVWPGIGNVIQFYIRLYDGEKVWGWDPAQETQVQHLYLKQNWTPGTWLRVDTGILALDTSGSIEPNVTLALYIHYSVGPGVGYQIAGMCMERISIGNSDMSVMDFDQTMYPNYVDAGSGRWQFGNPEDAVTIDPPYWDYGPVQKGAPNPSKTFTLANNTGSQVTVQTITPSQPWVLIQGITLPATIPNGGSKTFEAVVDVAQVPPGKTWFHFTVEYT